MIIVFYDQLTRRTDLDLIIFFVKKKKKKTKGKLHRCHSSKCNEVLEKEKKKMKKKKKEELKTMTILLY